MRLQLPSVSAHIVDDAGRLLLLRHSDAVVRETWEETGLIVSPDRIVGVYGGPEFVVRYPGGDEAQYVITAFQCTPRSGELRSTSDETSDARFCSKAGAESLSVASWKPAHRVTNV
jgi:8-oxo-dGTP pyrophosphatase MutT (NUDIX family)